VDDGGERVSVRDGVQEGLEGAWVGRVARGEGDRGARASSSLRKAGRPERVRPVGR
jgi:hypothetical protein